jgi:hypothetical protein
MDKFTDDYFLTVTTSQFNKDIKNISSEKIKEYRVQRRRVKNRIYSKDGRQRKKKLITEQLIEQEAIIHREEQIENEAILKIVNDIEPEKQYFLDPYEYFIL